MDSGWSVPRFSFGSMKLTSGIDLVVMLIGALAMSALLVQLESVAQGNTSANLPAPTCKDDDRMTRADIRLCLPHWNAVVFTDHEDERGHGKFPCAAWCVKPSLLP